MTVEDASHGICNRFVVVVANHQHTENAGNRVLFSAGPAGSSNRGSSVKTVGE
jgi:hypothetical protein